MYDRAGWMCDDPLPKDPCTRADNQRRRGSVPLASQSVSVLMHSSTRSARDQWLGAIAMAKRPAMPIM
ncbi:hypothetical protein BGCPKDLD_5004 [Methylorubrum suomiense]|uniref:Uncharacterized protein n=1 Tax=Methylorubrum suomiense TaxID=144191 RepID=A0ABQ4V2U5_9HYPH|nr:hypothetical protein BGCPKDLD_5004 [Methylorubrum suomiense]